MIERFEAATGVSISIFRRLRFPRFDGHGVKDMENDYDDEYEQAVHPGVQAGGRAAAADRE